MISGKLSNDTVWWLSTDGKKIWIESENLDQERFKDKGYNVTHGRIFRARKEAGELATSRLDSRRRKDAWVIKLEAMIDVYPELLEEINRKELEDNKKKKTRSVSNGRKEIKKDDVAEDIKKDIRDLGVDEDLNITISKEDIKKDIITEDIKKDIITEEKNIVDPDNKEIAKRKAPVREYFGNDTPYLSWINDEIGKSENGRIVILLKDLKEKMGSDFVAMQDMRIYFGLKKVLANIGATIDLKNSKGNSIAVIKKI